MSSRMSKAGEPHRDFAWSADERALLEAARRDSVPSDLEQRMRLMLNGQIAGFEEAARTSAAQSRTATSPGSGLFGSKLALWGMLSLVVLGSIAYRSSHGLFTTNEPAGSPSQPSAAERAALLAQPSEPKAQLNPALDSTSQHAALAGDQLRLEAELLDAARRALGDGTLPRAGQLLDRYSARFAQGVLRPESDVLRIELQMRRGQPDAAKVGASRFLSEYPNHPLRDRVRALTVTR